MAANIGPITRTCYVVFGLVVTAAAILGPIEGGALRWLLGATGVASIISGASGL